MATASTISVGNKLPSGLTVTHGPKDGPVQTVFLKGANDEGAIAGFGITNDVDRDWFKSWTEAHPDFPPVKNGSIFAVEANKARDAARERKSDVKTGLEGLNPDAPAPGIEPTEETKKELAKVDPDAKG